MMKRIIETVIRQRLLVGLVVLCAVALSIFAVVRAPLDAIPDVSDPQIIVYAKWARSPQLIESDVTEPLIKAFTGSPGVRSVRGATHMGYAFIYVLLDDDTKREAVQQRVTDRLNLIRGQLPRDAFVTVGPNASSMGWIYQYALVDRNRNLDLRDLRLLNENTVKPAIQRVAGVAEVASVGGLEKQFQLKIYPPVLAESGLTLNQVAQALRGALDEAGGRTIEVTNRDYQVRGVVRTDEIDDLENLVLSTKDDGRVIRLKDIGYLQVGSDQRRGIADLNGQGEVVGGIIIMEQKQNALQVAGTIKTKLSELSAALPAGVEIVPVYDRSELIWGTLQHFLFTLAYELGVVILITLFFLRNVRAAVAPVAILLLGALFTAMPLAAFHQTINLFSLAGLFIAIGEMVDATIVIVENCTAELAARGAISREERRQVIVRSIANVSRPLIFSLLIILTSFLPVFFLEAKEGRLFDPLAYTKTFAMGFSTLLTIVLLPSLVIWAFKSGIVSAPRERERRFTDGYRKAVSAVIKLRYAMVGLSAVLLIAAATWITTFQRDFMPEMEEGSLLYMPSTLPGLPAREAGWVLQQMDAKLKAFPEVKSVFGKLGRADTATDAAPVTMIEATISLKPEAAWRPGMTKAKLRAEMDKALQVPGYVNSWVQPISARVMMQDTGLQTPVGIKVRGPDVAVIESIGHQIEQLLRPYEGTDSVIAERISSGYFIDIEFDPAKLAAAGISAEDAIATSRYAVGGDNAVNVRQPDGTMVPLSIQYSSEYLDSLEKVRNAAVVGASGRSARLSELATVAVRSMPEMLRSDDGSPTGYVFITTKSVTPTDYVEKARLFLSEKLQLPDGYSIEWTGDHANAERAQKQLSLIVPLTLAIIFVLLVVAFHSVKDAMLIMLSAPFALVGGVVLQGILGYSMTTAVIVGYIAVFAVAIQTGIVMIIFIRQALAHREPDEKYMDAVLRGSVLRLRPKLMTVAVTTLSLLPVMLSTSAGMEIMKPIATPTIGGMLTSTIYVLFLIPCLFAIAQDYQNSTFRSKLHAGFSRFGDRLAPLGSFRLSRRMTVLLVLIIVAAVAALGALRYRQERQEQILHGEAPGVDYSAFDGEVDLPRGPERVLVGAACHDCHTTGRFAKGGSEKDWTDRLERMRRWGAKLDEKDTPAVAAYLARSFPPRAVKQAPPGSSNPSDPAMRHFMAP